MNPSNSVRSRDLTWDPRDIWGANVDPCVPQGKVGRYRRTFEAQMAPRQLERKTVKLIYLIVAHVYGIPQSPLYCHEIEHFIDTKMGTYQIIPRSVTVSS